MRISYQQKSGMYLATGPLGYGCVANSMEQLRQYLDAHFGAGLYELHEEAA